MERQPNHVVNPTLLWQVMHSALRRLQADPNIRVDLQDLIDELEAVSGFKVQKPITRSSEGGSHDLGTDKGFKH